MINGSMAHQGTAVGGTKRRMGCDKERRTKEGRKEERNEEEREQGTPHHTFRKKKAIPKAAQRLDGKDIIQFCVFSRVRSMD